VERAEAKVFANREGYKNFLITQPFRRAYGKLFTFSGNYRDKLRIRVGLDTCTWITMEEGLKGTLYPDYP
jgi:hypothetical protein